MSKYIDAERLMVFLKKKQESYKSKMVDPFKYPIDHIDLMAFLAREYQALIIQIDSLQQEQLDIDEIKREWYNKGYLEGRKNAHIPARELGLPKSLDFQQEQLECSGSLVDVDAVREDFITEVYRVLDADPTNDRANAIINAFDSLPTVSQRPKVNLAEEITRFFSKNPIPHEHITDWPLLKNTAIHFYGLRNRALEEAARHVYESWMGGTMDDVRRDMVELGRVINARKEGNK